MKKFIDAYLGDLLLLRGLGRDVGIILGTNFVASFSIFMALPFFTIYLVQETILSLTDAALILGVSVWMQQAGVLVGGMVADRFGLYFSMISGLALRVPAYCILALADSFWPMMLAGMLIGSGSALYLPAAKTALVTMSDEKTRPAILSARNICNNSGVALGPLVGSLVFTISPTVLFLVIAAAFFMQTILNSGLKVPTTAGNSKFRFSQVRDLIFTPLIWVLCLNMMLFFAFYIQLEVLAPVSAFALFGEIGPSMVFVINAVVVIVAQPPLVSFINTTKREYIFPLSFILFSMAFFIIAMSGMQPLLIFLAIAVLSIAEVLLTLRFDLEASALSKRYMGTCFGLIGFAAGIGGLIGSTAGATIYEWHEAVGRSLEAWFIFAVAAVAAIPVVLMSWKFKPAGATANCETEG